MLSHWEAVQSKRLMFLIFYFYVYVMRKYKWMAAPWTATRDRNNIYIYLNTYIGMGYILLLQFYSLVSSQCQ